MKSLFNHPYFLWVILALPSIPMIAGIASGGSNAHQLLHPTGEYAARFMIIAMMISPLQLLFPKASWPVWLMRRRRAFGVAAFCYALLHTAFYIVDLSSLQKILAEFFTIGIWTGWLAFAVFIPLALTSNNAMQRRLGKAWKSLQRWVYLAAAMTLLHWFFIHGGVAGVTAHFAPLVALEAYRLFRHFNPAKGASE